MIKILIVDDHPVVRKGLKEIITDMPESISVTEAEDGMSALEKIRGKDFELVILDIALPGMDGIEVLEQIKLEKPQCPVLMLSIYPEEQFAVRAFKSGASGYVTKASAPGELVSAVQKVLSGGKYVSLSLAENLVTFLQDTERPPHELLSNREYQVMMLAVSGKTTAEIASQLSLSIKTISTFRSRILRKTGAKNHTELIKYAIRHNLIS